MLQDRCLTDIIILAEKNGVLLQEEERFFEDFPWINPKSRDERSGMDGLEKRLADLLGT